MLRTTSSPTPVNVDGNDRYSSNGISSLPPEILSAIFECGKDMVDTDPLKHEGRTPQTMAFEWVVSHTCPLFRDIAITTPTLWTSIQFRQGSSLKWTLECISRSSSCLLDVSMEEGVDAPITEEALDVAIRHSLRWRSLSLSCAYEDVTTPITARLCKSPAPALRYLSLQVNNLEHIEGRFINDTTVPHIFKDGTPSLKFLRLGGWAMCLFRPPLKTIVTLHIEKGLRQGMISYSTFRRMITQSPFLEHLSVYGDIVREGSWPEKSDIIILPSLRSLRICGVGGKIYPGMLLGIDAPLLESLTLKELHAQDLDKLWDLNENTRYSNLTHLVFDGVDLSVPAHNHVFRTFPNVTLFYILDRSIDTTPIANILSMASVEVGQTVASVPWPKLREVGFNFTDSVQEEDMIRDMADRRREYGHPLSRFLLRIPEEDLSEVAEIELDGKTICEFETGDALWPPARTYIDEGDTQFI